MKLLSCHVSHRVAFTQRESFNNYSPQSGTVILKLFPVVLNRTSTFSSLSLFAEEPAANALLQQPSTSKTVAPVATSSSNSVPTTSATSITTVANSLPVVSPQMLVATAAPSSSALQPTPIAPVRPSASGELMVEAAHVLISLGASSKDEQHNATLSAPAPPQSTSFRRCVLTAPEIMASPSSRIVKISPEGADEPGFMLRNHADDGPSATANTNSEAPSRSRSSSVGSTADGEDASASDTGALPVGERRVPLGRLAKGKKPKYNDEVNLEVDDKSTPAKRTRRSGSGSGSGRGREGGGGVGARGGGSGVGARGGGSARVGRGRAKISVPQAAAAKVAKGNARRMSLESQFIQLTRRNEESQCDGASARCDGQIRGISAIDPPCL